MSGDSQEPSCDHAAIVRCSLCGESRSELELHQSGYGLICNQCVDAMQYDDIFLGHYAKRLVDRFDAVSDCELTAADKAWLVNNVQDTIDFCADASIKMLKTAAEKNKHLVGIIEDLYDAVDTAHLSDELRDDVREILKGDV